MRAWEAMAAPIAKRAIGTAQVPRDLNVLRIGEGNQNSPPR